MKPKASKATNRELSLRFLRWYGPAVAGIFAGVGLVMLLGATGNIPPLKQPDALFEVSTRTVLVAAGLLHLAVSGCCFVLRDAMSRGFIALWAGLNHLVYLAGMAWLQAAMPLPAVVVVAWQLRLSATAVLFLWKLFIACLLVGGMLLVLFERRRLKQAETEAYLKHWRQLREQQPSSPAQPGKLPAELD